MADETIFEFQARAARYEFARVAEVKAELARARRALAAERLARAADRARMDAAREAVDRLREEHRGAGASREHYVAILAMLRVNRALDMPTDQALEAAWERRR